MFCSQEINQSKTKGTFCKMLSNKIEEKKKIRLLMLAHNSTYNTNKEFILLTKIHSNNLCLIDIQKDNF